MRYIVLVLIPMLLFGEDLATLLRSLDQNLLLQSKEQEIVAKKRLFEATKGKNYPSLDLKATATMLKDDPTANLHLPIGTMPPAIKMGKRENFDAEIDLTYPIFSGFAIDSLIKRSKLEYEQSRLQKSDLKRKLYMKVISLYTTVYSLNRQLLAQKEAINATQKSYKKAKGFYQAQTINLAELSNIEAKLYELKAGYELLKSKRDEALEMLSYFVNKKITQIGSLPKIDLPSKDNITKTALNNREDILVLKKLLEIDSVDIDLAKSKNYPTLALVGALKTHGDDLKFYGDGYTNPNKSYIGAALNYKLFDGFETKQKIEVTKAKRLARILYFKDYQNSIKATLRSKLLYLKALKSELRAKRGQLKAQNSYYKLTYGRFINHLASSDELSRAIAAKAVAKASYHQIEAKIFEQKALILLESSLKKFSKYFFTNN